MTGSEEFLPIPETFVRGDDGRASFIPVRDKLKEEIGLLGCDRQVAHFIHDHQARIQIGLVAGLTELGKGSERGQVCR